MINHHLPPSSGELRRDQNNKPRHTHSLSLSFTFPPYAYCQFLEPVGMAEPLLHCLSSSSFPPSLTRSHRKKCVACGERKRREPGRRGAATTATALFKTHPLWYTVVEEKMVAASNTAVESGAVFSSPHADPSLYGPGQEPMLHRPPGFIVAWRSSRTSKKIKGCAYITSIIQFSAYTSVGSYYYYYVFSLAPTRQLSFLAVHLFLNWLWLGGACSCWSRARLG